MLKRTILPVLLFTITVVAQVSPRQDNTTFVGDNITVEIELVTRALDSK
jgi:hypothetical protein